MLAHNKEGKLCVEDVDGSVELDLSKLDEPGEGLYTEGCFALVEGEYTEDGTLEVVAMGQPPCEDRQTARSIYGHIDFLGKGATSLLEDLASEKNFQTFISFFCRMYGLTIHKHYQGCRRFLTIASKTVLSPNWSFSAGILPVVQSHRATHAISNGIKRTLMGWPISLPHTL